MIDDVTIDELRSLVQDAHLNLLVGAGTPGSYFSLLGDVENVLTEIDAVASADGDARDLARASVQAYFFDGVIAPNRPLIQREDSAAVLLRSYGELGRTLNRLLLSRRTSLLSKKINLFTTNVDLAFEVAFERVGIDLIDGFSGRIRPVYDLGQFGSLHYRTGVRYEHRSEAPTFDLYKLHGSVGWELTDDPAAPTGIGFDPKLASLQEVARRLEAAREYLVPISPDTTQSGGPLAASALLAATAGREVPQAVRDFIKAYEAIVIVNPEKQKFATTVLTEVYYELIRRFANELERENSLLLVHGFSFRDEHLRKIILRCARANPTLQILIFCWKGSSRAAYEALLPSEQVPNANVSYVVPADGEQLDLDALVRDYFAPLTKPASAASDAHVDAVLPVESSKPTAEPATEAANPFMDADPTPEAPADAAS